MLEAFLMSEWMTAGIGWGELQLYEVHLQTLG